MWGLETMVSLLQLADTPTDWFYVFMIIAIIIVVGELKHGAIQFLLGIITLAFTFIVVLGWGNIWLTLIMMVIGIVSMIRSAMWDEGDSRSIY